MYAQSPLNDNCKNAIDIPTGNGFGLGKYISKKVNLKNAARQSGESVDSLLINVGNDKKTVWYRFETKTRRSLNIQLRQKDSAITQNAVGFSVYKSGNCIPNQGLVSTALPTISKFGSSANSCLPAGVYLIQVCANKSANDSIWLELDLETPFPNNYDKRKDALDLGILSNLGNNNISFQAGCQSIDSAGEVCATLGPEYSQSAWITFQTPSYLDEVNMSFPLSKYASQSDTVKIGYNLYEGNAKDSTLKLKLIEGCVTLQQICRYYGKTLYCYGGFPSLKYSCSLKPNTYYTVQLFFHKDADYSLGVGITSNGTAKSLANDVKNLPVAYKLGLLSSKVIRISDNMSCDNIIPAGTCGMKNKNIFLDTLLVKDNTGHDTYQIDTFDMNSWFTFSIPASGTVNFTFNKLVSDPLQCGYIIRLFKGDASQNCAISLINAWRDASGANICLDSGHYSVQVLAIKHYRKKTNSCTNSNLGHFFSCAIYFTPRFLQKPAKHYKPSLAEDLGDITAKVATGITTSTDYFGSPDDSAIIVNHKYYSNFIFRQFYISKPLYLNISPIPKYQSNTYSLFFKGKASDGLNTLKALEPEYGGGADNISESITGSGCKPLPAGWYTIFSYRSNKCDDYDTYELAFKIESFNPCTQFDKPYKAGVFNKGQALTYGPMYGAQGDPRFKNNYLSPQQCPVCADTPFTPFPQYCYSNQYKPRRVSYYVFSIDKASTVTITGMAPAEYGYLYKFDVRKDSAHLGDSSYMIATCLKPFQYCRLMPGDYTFVQYSYSVFDNQFTILVDTIGYSRFDYARNAYDFGLLPLNNTVLTSPLETIYCTTSAHYLDPDNYTKKLFEKGEYSVPPIMPPNLVYKSSRPKRNLWFTFLLAGSGTCKMNIHPNTDGPNSNLFSEYVYKANSGNTPFSVLRNSAKVDSTTRQGLRQVQSISGYANGNEYLTFSKAGCDTVRYYVLLDYFDQQPENLNLTFSTDIQYSGTIYDNTGDYCSNAKLLNLSGEGSVSASLHVNCHSIGEGFGEDGSNMACLLSDSLYKCKSSWFRLHIATPGKYDLSFFLYNGTNVSSNAIRYRILYGSCGALTPGPCLGNAYGSFTLDCMSAGDYFVQVVMPVNATGTVQVSATALISKYQDCKPFDLLLPQANFATHGGCNGQPISFVNLSTQGPYIKYKWDFGDGTYSCVKKPIHKYTVNQAVTSFSVKLTVSDTVNNLTDSITLSAFVFNDPIIADAGNDTTVACGTRFHLKATCNYPDATYNWTPANEVDNPYSPTPLAYPSKKTVYKLYVHAENCDITDSITVKTQSSIKIIGQPYICDNTPTVLACPIDFDYYYWSTGEQTRFINVSKAGKYWLYGFHANGICSAVDTVTVVDLGNKPLLMTEKLAICEGDTFTMETPIKDSTLKYKWNTGDTTASITSHKLGTYWVQASNGKCMLIDTIHANALKNYIYFNCHDTSICDNVNFRLKAISNSGYVTWNTGETGPAIYVSKPGTYTATIGTGKCMVSNSVTINIIKSPGKPYIGADTTVCPRTIVNMDAGANNKNYRWNTGQAASKITVKDSGLYTVWVKDDNVCEAQASKRLNWKNVYLDLPKDTFYCKGHTLELRPKTNIVDLTWGNGDKDLSFIVRTSGQYYVSGTKDGCTLIDSINVRISSPPVVYLGKDTLICDTFDMVLDAGPGASYQWYPGGETSRRVYIKKHGKYTVVVKNIDGCAGSDTIRILEDCDPTIFVPNAFHAVKDDPNEYFKAYGSYISYFEMKVFNRWGQQIFSTENINKGWDGRYNGQLCEDGVYLYVIHYKGRYTNKQLTGTFHLLR